MKYIIIGGVAGGATAAARIRRNTEKAEIILFEKGEYISYANCGLPYYIGGVITDSRVVRQAFQHRCTYPFGSNGYRCKEKGSNCPYCRKDIY